MKHNLLLTVFTIFCSCIIFEFLPNLTSDSIKKTDTISVSNAIDNKTFNGQQHVGCLHDNHTHSPDNFGSNHNSNWHPFQQTLFEQLTKKHGYKERPEVCWHPDTDPAVIEAFHNKIDSAYNNSLFGNNDFKYQLGSRWSTTATNGSGLGQGDPTTLTWSFVPDGTAFAGGCGVTGESTDDSDLIAFLDGVFGAGPGGNDLTMRPWFTYFQEVFDRWEELTGMTYAYEDNDDGADFGGGGVAGVLNVRGDVRIGGHRLDGNSGVLACNYFPNNGDMIFDTDDNFYSPSNTLGFKNVISHEHGHGLGFSHSCPVQQTKLMEPFVSTAFDGPQEDDILAGNRQYGDINENNNTSASAKSLGPVTSGNPATETSISIDDATESDYYSFSVSSTDDASITITPTGTTYLAGPQNSNGTCSAGTNFDALTQSNLGVELIDSDGSTVLASTNAQSAGFEEVICNYSLSTGTYYVRVFGDASTVQMYDLQVEVGTITCPACNLVINEVDYDQGATDDSEFIELFNPCGQTIDLSTYSIQLVNGADNSTYETINLSGTLTSGDYFVICTNSANTPNCDLDVTTNIDLIQDGAPDAVALFDGAVLQDVLSYEGDVTGFVEGSGVGLDDNGLITDFGLSRVPNGNDTDMNNQDFQLTLITPGTVNAEGCPLISSFPYNESFETGLNDWEQSSADDFDWTWQTGGTPSGGTGPSGAYNGDYYFYTEASFGNNPSKIALLESPCYNLAGMTNPVFDFAYHMNGTSMGSLEVEISTDQGMTWSAPLWTISGDQGSNWNTHSLNISAYAGQVVKMRFKGTTGSNFSSDIAVDYVEIYDDGFTTPACTNLTDPLNGATGVSPATNLTWAVPSGGPTGYRLDIGTTSGGTDILDDHDVGNVTTYNPPSNFPINSTIYVTITPYNANGDAMGCSEESFMTNDGSPNCTNLSIPTNGTDGVDVTSDLTWATANGATGYRLDVGTTSGGTDILNNLDVGNTTTHNPSSDFPYNTQIFVNITPYNSFGDAIGCSEEFFITAVDPNDDCLSTFFSGGNSSYGNMFDISNLAANELTINSFEVNLLNAGSSNTIEIYYTTTASTHVGNETNSGAWTLLGSAVVISQGPNNPVQVPVGGLALPVGASKGLYVTCVESANMSYTNGSSTYSNSDLEIDLSVGKGNLYPFGGTFTPRQWNGTICYELASNIPDCTSLTDPLDGATNVDVSTSLTWAAASGSPTGYRLDVGTTSGGTDILNNQNVGNVTTYNPSGDFAFNQTIYVTITPYNATGDANGCSEESFTTQIAPPDCTLLTDPTDGSTNVDIATDLTWATASGSPTGYRLNVGTTSGGTDILNNFDAGNVTTYNPSGDFAFNQTIYVTITPYNATGDASGCSEESFTTQIAPPDCTSLTDPLDGATNVDVTTALTWAAASGSPTGYRLDVGTTSGGTDILNNFDAGNVTTYNPSGDFAYNSTIYVTITPYNATGDASGCSEESFTTQIAPPDCTSLTDPLDGATNVDVTTALTWAAASGSPTGYRLDVGTTSGGTDILNNFDAGNVTTYNPSGDFAFGQTIYVTITPYNSTGDASGCSEESFTTQIAPPDCTSLTDPLDGATNVDVSTSLTWAAASGSPTGYRLDVGTTSGGTDILNNQNVGNVTTYNPSGDFAFNQTIYVTITPYNATGDASGCSEESFTTQIAPPDCTSLTDPLDGATNVDVTSALTWAAASGSPTGYRLDVGTTSGGTDILNNYDVGNSTSHNPSGDFPFSQTIYVTITPYNATGDAMGCSEESFTTQIGPPSCTSLNNPLDGATNVDVTSALTWAAASGSPTGYRLDVGTTSGGTDILNAQDVGNVTTYNPSGDFPYNQMIYVTITPYNATGDAASCSEESFTTQIAPPDCTSLTDPLDGATNVDVTTALTWAAASGSPTGYRLDVGTTSGGTDILNNQDVGNITTYNPSGDFPFSQTIYVTITPYNATGDANGCSEESFTTQIGPPSCTSLTDPLDGATNVDITTALTWAAATGSPTGYRLNVGTTSGGTDILNNQDVGNVTTYNPSGVFDYNATIYVTITPYNATGDASGCSEESFTTQIAPPDCTSLTDPLDGATNVDVTTALTWAVATGSPTGYRLDVGTTSGGTDILNNHDVGNVTTYNPSGDFAFGQTIYVTITPYNATGDAMGCSEESFTTQIAPPDCTSLTDPLDGATNVDVTTALTWAAASGSPTGYFIEAGTTSGGTDILNAVDVGNVTSYDPPGDLPYNSTIYVTIIPYNATGDNYGCDEDSFTTQIGPPSCTTLSDPMDGDTDVDVTSAIAWTAALGSPTGYRLDVGTTSGGTDILNNIDVGNVTTYNPSGVFDYNATIYVTITPYNATGDANGCSEESFTTQIAPPDCTLLTDPTDGSTNVDIATDLTWATASGSPTGYRLNVGTTSGGTDILNNFDAGNATSYDLINDFDYNQTIYVTVIPYNATGDASGCSEESFTTQIAPPDCTSLTDPLDGATDVDVTSALTWAAASGSPTGYFLSVGTTSGGLDILNSVDVGNVTSYNPAGDFPYNTIIYVTIIPYNATGDNNGCDEESFTTQIGTPSCTSLTDPLDGATGVSISSDITWAAATGSPTGYRLDVGTTSGGTDILNNMDVGNVTSYNPSNDFAYNSTIYVTITPYNATGDAMGCSEESFTTQIAPPDCTSLTAPTSGASNIAVTADLTWAAATGSPTGYRLNVGTSTGGTDILNNFDVGNLTSFNPPGDFAHNDTIYVTIIPYNATGEATGCVEEFFYTRKCVPNLVIEVDPVAAGEYFSEGDLTSMNSVVEDGTSVKYFSDTGILLDFNFEVELNATFDAIIQQCENSVNEEIIEKE